MSDESPLRPDDELMAVQALVSILEPLSDQTRQRVLLFSLNRLGITRIGVPEIRVLANDGRSEADEPRPSQSIRTLKREKAPRFATHMAAVVGYYLSAVAPPDERKPVIGHQDVKSYFKKAGFKLPKSPTDVLIHATQSGLFDYLGNEQYRLTEAGRNLVLNELPSKTK